MTQRSYRRTTAGYDSGRLPPLTFTYSRPVVDPTFRLFDPEQLENLPVGTQGAGYRWVDLDGEGLSGVLTEQGGAWFHAPNRGR